MHMWTSQKRNRRGIYLVSKHSHLQKTAIYQPTGIEWFQILASGRNQSIVVVQKQDHSVPRNDTAPCLPFMLPRGGSVMKLIASKVRNQIYFHTMFLSLTLNALCNAAPPDLCRRRHRRRSIQYPGVMLIKICARRARTWFTIRLTNLHSTGWPVHRFVEHPRKITQRIVINLQFAKRILTNHQQ